MQPKLFFADSRLSKEIETLRMQEYAKASGFVLDLSTLQWKQSDDDSYVLAAEKEGQIVSTMRGEFIESPSLLSQKLECPWEFPLDLKMPVLLLSRAATHSSLRSSGLNLALRYRFLRLAMAYKVRFVVGTFVSGSPREQSLRDMGYQFFENTLGWQQSSYRSLRPVQVVALDLGTHGDQALHYCEERVSKTIEEYPFEGNFPELRFVRNL